MLPGLQTAGRVAPGVPGTARYQLGSSLSAPVFQEGSDPPTPFPSAHRQLGFGRDPGGPHGLLPGSSGAADFVPVVLGFSAAGKARQDRVHPRQAPGWLLPVPNAREPDLGWSWAALHRPVPPFPGTHGTGRRWGPCSCGEGQDLGGDGVFWEPFKTQGGGLGGGQVQADPQDEAKGFLPKKAERWERTIGTAICTP